MYKLRQKPEVLDEKGQVVNIQNIKNEVITCDAQIAYYQNRKAELESTLLEVGKVAPELLSVAVEVVEEIK